MVKILMKTVLRNLFLHISLNQENGVFSGLFRSSEKESRSSETHFHLNERESHSSKNGMNLEVLSGWFSLKRGPFSFKQDYFCAKEIIFTQAKKNLNFKIYFSVSIGFFLLFLVNFYENFNYIFHWKFYNYNDRVFKRKHIVLQMLVFRWWRNLCFIE